MTRTPKRKPLSTYPPPNYSGYTGLYVPLTYEEVDELITGDMVYVLNRHHNAFESRFVESVVPYTASSSNAEGGYLVELCNPYSKEVIDIWKCAGNTPLFRNRALDLEAFEYVMLGPKNKRKS